MGLPNPKALVLLFHLPKGRPPATTTGARGELLPKSAMAPEMSSLRGTGWGPPSDPPRADLACLVWGRRESYLDALASKQTWSPGSPFPGVPQGERQNPTCASQPASQGAGGRAAPFVF